jgi:hypothetical protein
MGTLIFFWDTAPPSTYYDVAVGRAGRMRHGHPAKRSGEEPLEVALLDDDEHRLKLIHHPDGFVQFSGQGIVSGRDSTGKPNGLGLQSFPLGRPTAGPAMGITIQKPAAFKSAGDPRNGEVVFRARELASAETDTGLVIELYYFQGLWRRFVRIRDSRPVIWIRHPSGAVIEARVCWPPSHRWERGFVGVDLYSAPIKFGDAESGFAFSSPTALREHDEGDELEADALIAVYPAAPLGTSLSVLPIMFPVRDDPPYTRGGESPSGRP